MLDGSGEQGSEQDGPGGLLGEPQGGDHRDSHNVDQRSHRQPDTCDSRNLHPWIMSVLMAGVDCAGAADTRRAAHRDRVRLASPVSTTPSVTPDMVPRTEPYNAPKNVPTISVSIVGTTPPTTAPPMLQCQRTQFGSE